MSDLFTSEIDRDNARRLAAAGWTERLGRSGRAVGVWQKGRRACTTEQALAELDAETKQQPSPEQPSGETT